MDSAFDLLPHTSRIWIYQANRKFTPPEEKKILEKANMFVKNWNAHGNNLQAEAVILHNRFLIFSVNEDQNGASGCSIDKSVRFIRELEKQYQISLLDRKKLAFYQGDEIQIAAIRELKSKIDSGTITKETLIFNNLVEKKGDLDNKWIVAAKNSWLKKYFTAN
jgi:hypothetical protein